MGNYTLHQISDLRPAIEAEVAGARAAIEHLSDDKKFQIEATLDRTFIPNVNSEAIGFDSTFFKKMALVHVLGRDKKITAKTVLLSK
jgi:hypothetical protein